MWFRNVLVFCFLTIQIVKFSESFVCNSKLKFQKIRNRKKTEASHSKSNKREQKKSSENKVNISKPLHGQDVCLEDRIEQAALKISENFSKEGLSITFSEAKNLVRSYPALMYVEAEKWAQCLDVLRKETDICDQNLLELLLVHPQLLGSNPLSLKRKLSFCKVRLNASQDELVFLLQQKPSFSETSLKTQLEPLADFFPHESAARLLKAVLRYPEVLGFSVSRKLLPKVVWMCQNFDLHEDEVKNIMLSCPQLMWITVDKNLLPKLQYLMTEVGLTRSQCGKILKAYPTLMTLSLKNNLQPKVNFLLDEGLGKERLKLLFIGYPAVLGSSLEKKLKPRLMEIKKMGIDIELIDLKQIFYQEKRFQRWASKVNSEFDWSTGP